MSNVQDPVQLVRDLLALWRLTRHPDVAALLEGASSAVVRARGRVLQRNTAKVDPTFQQIAQGCRAEDLGLLVPRALATVSASESLAHLRLLRPWAPDPRLATFAHEWLTRPVARGDSWRSFNGMLFELLEEVSDPRSIPVLDDFAKAPLIDYGEALRKTSQTRARKLGASIRPASDLDPTTRQIVVRLASELGVKLRAPTGARPEHIDELVSLALADLQDDETLQVLADALLSVGDPRGELIMLQLARGDGPPSPGENALLRKHHKTLAGALGRVARDVEFSRGFPSKVTLTGLQFVSKTFGAPDWRWVREIDATALDTYDADWLAGLLEDPAARGLPHLERIRDRAGLLERVEGRWRRVPR